MVCAPLVIDFAYLAGRWSHMGSVGDKSHIDKTSNSYYIFLSLNLQSTLISFEEVYRVR